MNGLHIPRAEPETAHGNLFLLLDRIDIHQEPVCAEHAVLFFPGALIILQQFLDLVRSLPDIVVSNRDNLGLLLVK